MMVSTYKISHYLEGIDYPADKQSLLKQARKNNAPYDVIDAINKLSDQNFDTMTALWHGIGQE